jgi:hypothetical protein
MNKVYGRVRDNRGAILAEHFKSNGLLGRVTKAEFQFRPLLEVTRVRRKFSRLSVYSLSNAVGLGTGAKASLRCSRLMAVGSETHGALSLLGLRRVTEIMYLFVVTCATPFRHGSPGAIHDKSVISD